jgi:hypothetical protein
MVGLPSSIARYENNQERAQVKRIIVDREGMAPEFLASLHAERRAAVTILQTNQDQDLTSFCDVGTFVPLGTDTQGRVIREVAPASIVLPHLDYPGEQPGFQVALIVTFIAQFPFSLIQQTRTCRKASMQTESETIRAGGKKAGKPWPLPPKIRQQS